MAVPDTLKPKQHPSLSTEASHPTPRKLMEQLDQYRQQAQQQAQGSVNNVRNYLAAAMHSAPDSLRHYTGQYPRLAAFLFTLLVLSAVPVACFALFTLVTSAVFLTIALIGFGFVEGLFLMAGGGVLLMVLGGIALVTTIGFAWASVAYAAWRGSSFLAGKIMEGGLQVGQKTQEAISHMQQQRSCGPATASQGASSSSPN